MNALLGEEWPLGPQRTLNLLFARISDLDLGKGIVEILQRNNIYFVGDLLFMNEKEILLKINSSEHILRVLREKLASYGAHEYSLGMFAHLPAFVKMLFSHARITARIVVDPRGSISPSNAHPSTPPSEIAYHGGRFNRGEW